MSRVELHLDNKSEWIKIFDPRDHAVFVQTDAPPEVGQSMRIDLAIGDNGPRVILRGTVVSRFEKPEGDVPAGCVVALGVYEREKINYLNGFVRGGLLNLRERRRLPLRLSVTYGGVDGPCRTFTRDINEEGIFIITEQPLPEHTKVHLLVKVPKIDKPLSLTGTVTHTVIVEDEDVPGMGIVFAKDERTEELIQIIDDLEKDFLSGSLPEEVLL
ncbi:MAG: PilZ domain-containing protein [Proteobacteria bacterium]|nr:PilZ domain-containing protein [Pseudomonadota bacterium]